MIFEPGVRPREHADPLATVEHWRLGHVVRVSPPRRRGDERPAGLPQPILRQVLRQEPHQTLVVLDVHLRHPLLREVVQCHRLRGLDRTQVLRGTELKHLPESLLAALRLAEPRASDHALAQGVVGLSPPSSVPGALVVPDGRVVEGRRLFEVRELRGGMRRRRRRGSLSHRGRSALFQDSRARAEHGRLDLLRDMGVD